MADPSYNPELFIGRDEDMTFLNSLYDRRKFMSCAILGRRRIGKTTLLEEFCRGKNNMFFRFRRGSMTNNLIHMSRVVSMYSGIEEAPYADLEQALNSVATQCSLTKTVIVFDEYPFISSIDESVSSDFQHFIDSIKHTETMVVF